MNLLLGLVCDHARVSDEGKLDVDGVFHDLYAPGFPARQDHLVLVLVVEWDPEDEGRYAFRVDLMTPSGSRSLTVDGHSDVDRRPGRPPPRTRLIMPLEDVVFPEPGRYAFDVKLKGEVHEGPVIHLVQASFPGSGPGRAP